MDRIIIMFAVGLGSFIAGYLIASRASRGILRMAKEYRDGADDVLERILDIRDEIERTYGKDLDDVIKR